MSIPVRIACRSVSRGSAVRAVRTSVTVVVSALLLGCRGEVPEPLQMAEAAGTLVERPDAPPPPPLAVPRDSASVAYDRCLALYQTREELQQRREQGAAPTAADTTALGQLIEDASERYAVCRWGYSTFADPRPLP